MLSYSSRGNEACVKLYRFNYMTRGKITAHDYSIYFLSSTHEVNNEMNYLLYSIISFLSDWLCKYKNSTFPYIDYSVRFDLCFLMHCLCVCMCVSVCFSNNNPLESQNTLHRMTFGCGHFEYNAKHLCQYQCRLVCDGLVVRQTNTRWQQSQDKKTQTSQFWVFQRTGGEGGVGGNSIGFMLSGGALIHLKKQINILCNHHQSFSMEISL